MPSVIITAVAPPATLPTTGMNLRKPLTSVLPTCATAVTPNNPVINDAATDLSKSIPKASFIL
ncbi:hypothetical protein [Helicobacter pylori]|uniref:hypothetical protein n=1 Tax=Helicobacter pylori TaxID=210 RepID=UPI0013CE265C